MKVLVYGAGKNSEHIITSMLNMGHDIIGVFDGGVKPKGYQVCGFEVHSPDRISELDYDIIIVSSDLYYEEIKENLVSKYNIDERMIKKSHYLLAQSVLEYYETHKDVVRPEYLMPLDYIRDKENMSCFNYPYAEQEMPDGIEVGYDDVNNYYYVLHNEKRLYLAKKYSSAESVRRYYWSLCKEQNEKSPHRYLDSDFQVNEGDVVLDGGVAEGNFSIDVIDRAKHIILVEGDPEWIRPLQLTFAPYAEKVTIINKMLSNHCDDNNITIDQINQIMKIDCIKLDIKGSEVIALRHADQCLRNNENVRLAVCAYHNFDDERNIREILEAYGYECVTTKGYMNFIPSSEQTKLFVRGLIKAKKKAKTDKSRIILWGAGKMLASVVSCLDFSKCDILGVVDKKFSSEEELEYSFMGYNPEILSRVGYDYVVITARNYKSIELESINRNVNERRIIAFWNKESTCNIWNERYRNELFLKEELEIAQLKVENMPYELGVRPLPRVESALSLIQKLIHEKCSLCRFGDGEFEIMLGNQRPWFQNPNNQLKEKLCYVFNSSDDGIAIAIADNFGNLDKYTENAANAIRRYVCNGKRDVLMRIIGYDRNYWDAYVSRPYIMYEDKTYASALFKEFKYVWKDRNVIIVEGEYSRIGVGNNLFVNANSIRRIICPYQNAYDQYERILKAVLQFANDDDLVLISLGPTATVMAYDVYRAGYQAIDIGQLDNEYEWFLMGATTQEPIDGKGVAELSWYHTTDAVCDLEYVSQVVWRYSKM